MLTKIEAKLEEFFVHISNLPADWVQTAEKVSLFENILTTDYLSFQLQEKERRQKLRAEKLEIQKLAQENRIKRALERSQAPTKKKVRIHWSPQSQHSQLHPADWETSHGPVIPSRKEER